ncbi:MAG TPA: type II secretion system F family protein [Candidatus Hydrogenedentes bacterium]|nr:type II secretion system F family protein [Candidatus Hydrogenedentota bacterium]HPG65757.1 type II secretion system F family protein [Candidatus Hydrogenedentota bacterium]
MPAFQYRATDPSGKPVEGACEAESVQGCIEQLRSQGLRVNAVTRADTERHGLLAKRSLSWNDLEVFNRQLADIVRSGLPISESLRALAEDMRKSRLRRAVDDLRAEVEKGTSFSEALERSREGFPRMYTRVVRAGEQAGNLVGVLNHLCDYSARMVELKHLAHEALAYPALVLVVATGVMGFFLANVEPVFVSFAQDFGAQMPPPTRLFVALGKGLSLHWPVVAVCTVAGILALIMALRSLRRTHAGAYALDWLKLHVPVVGTRNRVAAVGRFSHALGLMLRNEVPILDSLELAGAAADNEVLRAKVLRAGDLVENGTPVPEALGTMGFFGSEFCWALQAADNSGTLDVGLLQVAENHERDVAHYDRVVASMAPPVILLVLGVVVAVVIVAMFSPIYTMGDAVSR